jgi:hypothetical protein
MGGDIIRRSFRDAAWYWAPGTAKANGALTFAAPVKLVGRFDSNPVKVVTPQETVLRLGARFTTEFQLAVGGFLLPVKADDVVTDESSPTSFPTARQVLTILVLKSFNGEDVFYVGGLS